MTETSLASPPQQLAAHPADVLLHLIVALLARMFLPATNGDLAFARMAAFETINQYHPRNHIDLIAIAQIIACSLAALSSASLALTDDLSLSMTLRLRANNVALNRVVEQARRALRDSQRDDRGPEAAFVPDPNQAQYEEDVIAEVAAAQLRTAEALARYEPVQPTAAPSLTSPPAASSPAASSPAATVPAAKTTAPATTQPAATAKEIAEKEWQARWASAMTDVAHEFTADLQNLPPAERELAARRAAILASTARQLLSGDVPPRLRPGALDSHLTT